MMLVAVRGFSVIHNFSHRFCSNYARLNKIKEINKNVKPFCQINVDCSIKVKVLPFDVLSCPDSNRFRATITSVTEKSSADLKVKVEDENVKVSDENIKGDPNELTCLLEVPVKADLNIDNKANVEVSGMYSDFIKVKTTKDIKTKNIRSTTIYLDANSGNIQCDGLTLAHKIDVHAGNTGNIALDKIQGDILHCKAEKGNITTNSCYVETSKFVTENGSLNLKNVHKKSEAYVLKEGNIDMYGIHGNVYVKSISGDLNLQFSEIYGDNIIISNDSKNVTVNISDFIEENCFVEIHSDKIILDDSICHLSDCLEKENCFRLGKEEGHKDKLLICTKGELKFGKMSWADSVKITMGIKDL